MFDELVRPKVPETVEEPSEVPVTVVAKPKKKKVVRAGGPECGVGGEGLGYGDDGWTDRHLRCF